MASKDLTVRVRLNTKDAERNIGRLVNNINRINNSLNKAANGTSANLPKNMRNAASETHRWADAVKRVNTSLNGSKSLIGSINSGLKTLASRYLGIVGMGSVIKTSDTITSSENKLNYVSARNLGASGTNADGSYTQATFNASQDAMDKMYTSAQKVRMSYGDMMSNVSKSMALAGKSFDNNTDKAIRFQEIMAEAYAVGGASAQEMHTSMYQMIQALGAGILAGDELRSVREGAPLAYQAIEEFAQEVYGTEESLKDLASQGKITSDMVVAAVMDSGKTMDKAFAQTEQTFAQTWNQIKNAATRAFLPVAKVLRTALNKAIDSGLISKAEKIFTAIAKAVLIVCKVIENVINWIADNWNWLKHVILIGLSMFIAYFLIAKTVAIASAIASAVAWMIANLTLLVVIATVGLLIYTFILFKTGAIDACTAITIAILILGAAIGVVMLIMGNMWGLLVIGITLALVAIIHFFEYIAGAITWLGILFKNIGLEIAGFFVALSWVVANAFMTAVEFVVDCFNGSISWICALAVNLWETLKTISTNIGIAFENAWIWAKNSFWEFIADVVDGVSRLEPVINGIAKLLGKDGVDFGAISSGIRSKKSEYIDYVKVNAFNDGWASDAWNNGTSKWSAPKWAEDSSWSEMQNSVGGFEEGWSQDAFDIGYDWGNGIKDSINQWASQFQSGENGGENVSTIDKIANSLGIDTSQFGGLFDDKNLDDLLGDVGDIAGNTGKIADGMELTEEDLKYLRSIAEMEWKKEFTTAEIKVEMTNNNTVNGESDLDGIVTKLSDKLYEELNIVADGVYAY